MLIVSIMHYTRSFVRTMTSAELFSVMMVLGKIALEIGCTNENSGHGDRLATFRRWEMSGVPVNMKDLSVHLQRKHYKASLCNSTY